MKTLQTGLLSFYRTVAATDVLKTAWGRALFESTYWLYKCYWETGSIAPLQAWVSPGSLVIDVGANIGYFTLRFAAWVQNGGKVLALEPESLNYARLERAVRRAGFSSVVESIQVAAADTAGEGLLEINPAHPGDHKLGTSGVPVALTTIDSLVAARGWPNVSLIKIDVQGAESRVLAGSVETIGKFRPALFVEIDPQKLEQSGSSSYSLLESLTSRGYSLHTLKRNGTSGPLEVSQATAVARAKGYIDLLCCP
jgi:FkbM family methyltransferase